ncbi:hypothetical protein DT019_24315 [Streptomyces sp. SDr-06]|uniref:hypothetical protein n=1 Tax=Streptomyces sp. SDr-06 TaxID=2267702 RepID=UPI000DEAB385|nr:hypothetical protein [Streptomyces sp. SDr-06]RCH65961.1 hypothetical protein DT019_24315 [Streptomyces sp. SDr-06]
MSEQYPYQQQPQYDQYGQPVQPQPPFPYEPYQDQQQYTQTWEGQTWDTQYQPTIPPVQQPAEPAPRRGRHAQPAPDQPWQESAADAAYAADTAYLPPQSAPRHGPGTASVPLPPEVPMAPAPAPAPVYEPAAAPASAPADGPAYSSPTTVGNTRITDAQRARAEGRSPIIAPGMRPAALTAVLALLLAVAAPVGPYALAVPLVLLQAVTAAGWFRLNGMWPARQGIALAFAGGLVADVALLALGREDAPAAILGTLGVWVLLTLVLQLRSHADPDERMYGLMATVASAALAILAGGFLAAPPHAVSVGAAAVAVAALARALPLPSAASVVVALLAAAGVGIAVGGLVGIGASGALLGLAAGGCALIGLRVASYDYPSRFVHMTAGVALPLTAAVPVLYLIGRAVA